ncbi:hypothetical protein DFP72DRAFT_855070 [Ephemerocybe angulata]|uniref:Uncharacterized protein n=1 Tax=Ephemerocybe angulata TaxID=980116 RepID=A0A8H6HIB3_9AGAR|nr:hypothetical protein DFP72DRAFT_855070 [Tulosesus angulatus]
MSAPKASASGYASKKRTHVGEDDPSVTIPQRVEERPKRIRYKTEKAKAAEEYPLSSDNERAEPQPTGSSMKENTVRRRPPGVHPASLVRTSSTPITFEPPPHHKLVRASYRQALVEGSAGSGNDSASQVSDSQYDRDEAGSLVDFIDDRAEDALSVGSGGRLSTSPAPVSQPARLKRKPNARHSDGSVSPDGAHISRPIKRVKRRTDAAPSKGTHGTHSSAKATSTPLPGPDVAIVISDDDWTVVVPSNKRRPRSKMQTAAVSTRPKGSHKDRAPQAVVKRESLTPELPNLDEHPNGDGRQQALSSRRPAASGARSSGGRALASQVPLQLPPSGRRSRNTNRVGRRETRGSPLPCAMPDATSVKTAASVEDPLAKGPSTPERWSTSPVRGSAGEPSNRKKGKGTAEVCEVPSPSSSVSPSVFEDENGDDLKLGLKDAVCGLSYDKLPVLMDVELVPLYSQDAAPEETALMPSEIMKAYSKRSSSTHVPRLLKTLIEMPSHKVFVNAARAPTHIVQPSVYQSSVYLVIPKSVFTTKVGKLPYNACFFATGVCAYSNVCSPASKTFGDRTTNDHRIGMYPFEFEYQRMLTYIGHVAKKKEIRFSFTSGVLAFTTKVEGSSEVSMNYGPLASKSVFHTKVKPASSSSDNLALEHLRTLRFPSSLTYLDKVPILDARGAKFLPGKLDFSHVHTLPVYPLEEVKINSIITVGFTANTPLAHRNFVAHHAHLSTSALAWPATPGVSAGCSGLSSLEEMTLVVCERAQAIAAQLPGFDTSILPQYQYAEELEALIQLLVAVRVSLPPVEDAQYWSRVWDIVALWEDVPFFCNFNKAYQDVVNRIRREAETTYGPIDPAWEDKLDMGVHLRRRLVASADARSIKWRVGKAQAERLGVIVHHLMSCGDHRASGMRVSPCLCKVTYASHDESACCCFI